MKIIDVHTHGIGGFDTRTTSEQHILKIAEIQGSLGVSGIVPTVYPDSIGTMRENMHAIREAIARQTCRGEQPSALTNPKPEAKIIGIHLEGPFLNPSKCGALDAASFLTPEKDSLNKLIDGFEDIVKIITIAPELEGAVDMIRGISRKGIIASMGHSEASYAEAEAGFRAGARGITHIFNAMRGIHHREPGLAGFGLMNQDIYIEVIADPFHLHPKFLEFILAVKNPERIIIISDTVKTSISASAPHALRTAEHILLGGSMPLTESAGRLIQTLLISTSVNKFISENPERYLATYD
jgi:N-acetylglucosamine-6-phosphate deacetylase